MEVTSKSLKKTRKNTSSTNALFIFFNSQSNANCWAGVNSDCVLSSRLCYPDWWQSGGFPEEWRSRLRLSLKASMKFCLSSTFSTLMQRNSRCWTFTESEKTLEKFFCLFVFILFVLLNNPFSQSTHTFLSVCHLQDNIYICFLVCRWCCVECRR